MTVGAIGTQAGIPTVNGRDLWVGLEIGEMYTHWVKRQVESLQLVENEDYIIFAENSINPGRPRKEVAFTLDAAKHIAMASRTPKGRGRMALRALQPPPAISSSSIDET